VFSVGQVRGPKHPHDQGVACAESSAAVGFARSARGRRTEPTNEWSPRSSRRWTPVHPFATVSSYGSAVTNDDTLRRRPIRGQTARRRSCSRNRATSSNVLARDASFEKCSTSASSGEKTTTGFRYWTASDTVHYRTCVAVQKLRLPPLAPRHPRLVVPRPIGIANKM
jgi:hypothetical protein